MTKCAPLVPSNSSCIALVWSLALSFVIWAQPASLNAPPKPSQVCRALLSLTVTFALPLVTVAIVAVVFQ